MVIRKLRHECVCCLERMALERRQSEMRVVKRKKECAV